MEIQLKTKQSAQVIRWVIREEGGDTLTDDPIDPGGPTRYGIAENWNKGIQAQHLDLVTAEAILYKKYYQKSGCDHLTHGLALAVMDGALNPPTNPISCRWYIRQKQPNSYERNLISCHIHIPPGPVNGVYGPARTTVRKYCRQQS